MRGPPFDRREAGASEGDAWDLGDADDWIPTCRAFITDELRRWLRVRLELAA